MRNAPLNSMFESLRDDHEEMIPPGSSVRLYSIGAVFVAVSVLIFARLAWVQLNLTDEYLASLEKTTTEYEVIPARDGRILAGSDVFAADEDRYVLQIHYRWLQTVPDPVWIDFEIRQRLSAKERRDQQLVAHTRDKILSEHRKLHENLRQLKILPDAEYDSRRISLEKRVSAVARSVNERRVHRNNETPDEREMSVTVRLFHAVRKALTTTPGRPDDERIIVREEETWHTFVSDLPQATAVLIGEHPQEFPGARILASTQRRYPLHRLGSHLVGARTVTVASSDENPAGAAGEERAGVVSDPEMIDSSAPGRHGRFGVEMSYDQEIRGVPGIRTIVRDRRRRIRTSEVTRKPVSGRDVHLTIDVKLQELCEELLAEALTDRPRILLTSYANTEEDQGESAEDSQDASSASEKAQPVPTGGSIVVMDAATGQVLAAASAPGFDLSLFAGGSREEWDAVNSDQRRPFITRFTSMALPPGSVFKCLTAIAALEEHVVQADVPFVCQGYLKDPQEHRCLIFRQYRQGHDEITLPTALARSCNVYFFDAAERMGFQPLAKWASTTGFGQRTGIDLPFEKSGNVPSSSVRTVSRTDRDARRLSRETLGFSIGQSRLTVTPIQVARLMALIANGGWLVTPHVVSRDGVARKSDDAEMSGIHGKVRVEGVHEETLREVREGMIATVEEPGGTGYRTARLQGVAYGGKTGTAETAGSQADHAWFAGFAPAENPRYAFVVVLEHGGSGSHSAGPIAREIVRYLVSDRS